MNKVQLEKLLRHIVKEVLREIVTPDTPRMSNIDDDVGNFNNTNTTEKSRNRRQQRIQLSTRIKNKEDELRNRERENRGREDQWKKDRKSIRDTLQLLKRQQSQI